MALIHLRIYTTLHYRIARDYITILFALTGASFSARTINGSVIKTRLTKDSKMIESSFHKIKMVNGEFNTRFIFMKTRDNSFMMKMEKSYKRA